MSKKTLSRRSALILGSTAAALPLVHIRTAGAAGKLSIGFWDHWVPAGNDAMKKQIAAFSEKHKVDVQADFITSVGSKNLLTIAAEAQAKTGHDVQSFPSWEVHNNADNLEPVDDLMKALMGKYGEVSSSATYLGRVKGRWMAVPSSSGSQNKPPCARISMMKDMAGLDVKAMYPSAGGGPGKQDDWTWDAFLKAAEACQKGGKPFGIGLGQTTDSEDFAGALFAAYGAELVNAKGDITVKTEPVRQVMEYAQKLVKVLPPDAVSYDDASNNRALISGQSALICNPPSAWAVALRDNKTIAEDCWTISMPKGPKGRMVPSLFYLWGIWKFSPNKSAAKELIMFLSERENVEERCAKVLGYDIPPFDSMLDFKIWEDVGPPKGTVYNYPIRKEHGAIPWVAMSPAPPEIAVQAYNQGIHSTMFAKLKSGQTIDQTMAWAQNELEGFVR
jgi:ABC-type glycerol-3-phosphate transport system substrate-binding protein